ncbi:hypothetical protein ACLOJK_011667 [Asimina triloba]
MERSHIPSLIHWFLLIRLLLTVNYLCLGADELESDVQCLKGIKESLLDPFHHLSSWNFNNKTRGFICDLKGVECRHPDSNEVVMVDLSNMGLRGRFPSSLNNCTKLTGLDLSNNSLSGPLPHHISRIVPFLTSFNLSYNKFSGKIPPALGDLAYLAVLDLQHNEFRGRIPKQIGRFILLNVTKNFLSGEIPMSVRTLPSSSFANNPHLCGEPLDACRDHPTRLPALLILVRKYRQNSNQMSEVKVGIDRWTWRTYAPKGVKVSSFEKFVPKMRLSDITKATDSFSEDHIISLGRTGPMYRAILPNGSLLAVKRMQNSHRSVKRFISETTVLGSIQHPNVVPLLGFCIARGERLLVYKYMPKGTVYQQLHQSTKHAFRWPLRLRVAIGVARGLVWLHHRCKPCVIHRHISSESILLDEAYEPVISNFKSARLMGSIANSRFGSPGYVAPEYERMFEAIPKGDVYSFGVVLLELITGNQGALVANGAPRKFKGSVNLVEWISCLSDHSRLSDAIDKSLAGTGHDIDLFEFLNLACSCVVPNPEERPTMLEVYRHLCRIGKRDVFIGEEDLIQQLPPNEIQNEYAYLVVIPQEIQGIP